MSLPKNLTLIAWKPEVEGCGEELVVKFRAYQQTKSKRTYHTDLHLRMDRFLIHDLTKQIAEMQKRDRERIAEEVERLRHEISPLVTNEKAAQ